MSRQLLRAITTKSPYRSKGTKRVEVGRAAGRQEMLKPETKVMASSRQNCGSLGEKCKGPGDTSAMGRVREEP